MDRPYTVAPGDSLWHLSAKHYGNPTLWPLIFEYNNLSRTVKKTGSRIIDPDLIFIKQQLIIPDKSLADTLGRNGLNDIRNKICRNRANHQPQGSDTVLEIKGFLR